MVSAKWFKAALAHINDGVAIAECDGDSHQVAFINDAFERITGYGLTDLHQQGFDLLCSTEGSEDSRFQLQRAVSRREPCTLRVRSTNKSGHIFWCELKISFLTQNKTPTMIAVCKDISHEEHIKDVLDKVSLLYREMSKRLEYASEVDALTQLKSRNHLSTRGEFVLGAAKRQRLRLHTIVVEIDNFDQLSRLGGNDLSDQCLIAVANFITIYFCRATDIAIRMGDDQFVILCLDDEDCRVLERAELFRQELQSAALQDSQCGLHSVCVRVGIYSVTPEKHTTIEEIVAKASQLAHQPKCGGSTLISHHRDGVCATIKH